MNPIRLSLIVSLSSLLALPLTNACTPLWANNNAREETLTQLDSNQLKQIAQEITVRVLSGDNQSSGVLIAKSGQDYTVVTNVDTLIAGEPYQIQTPDGKVHEATLLSPEVENDIALLQFGAESDYAIAEIETNANLAAGETVFAAGYPFDSKQLQLTSGEISLLSEKPIEGGYSIGYTNEIGQGMSGGAILNSQGKLIGINGKIPYAILDTAYEFEDGSNPDEQQLQRMRQLAWGVPAQTIINSAPQIAKLPETTTQNLTGVAAQVDEIAQKITVLINIPDGSNGSGAIIARRRNTYYVLTAAHVVENEQEQYTVVTPDGQQYEIAKTIVLPGADLAVVQFNSNQDYQVATLGRYNLGVQEKSWIFLSGFPGVESGKQPQRRLTAGTVLSREIGAIATKNLHSLTNTNGYELVYTNLSQGGMSGGAVLDSRGHLIGIHAAAEAEAVIQQSGDVAQFNLGRSLGVPIDTFLGVAKRAKVNPNWLAIATDKPKKLNESEVEKIKESLLVLETPAEDASATDWLDYGNQLWRGERYDESIAAFDQAIAIQPDFEQAYYAKGVALGSHEKAEAAIAAFSKAIEINPRFYEAWRERSNEYYYSLEQYEGALADINQAITLEADDWNLHWIKSGILIQMFRNDEALEAAKQAVALNSEHPFTYEKRGLAYAQLGEYEQAIADYNRSLEINPEYEHAYFFRGTVYDDLGNDQKALADYNRAIEINPEFYSVYLRRASTYASLGEYDQAFADLEQVIKIEPELPDPYAYMGFFYTQLGEYEKVVTAYTEAIKLDPEYREAYDGRGLAYINLEKYDEAIADLSRALELEPEFGDARIYQNAADLGGFQNLSVKEATDFWSYFNRGNAYLRSQKLDEAIADYTKSIKINPQYDISYFFRGFAYQFSGKPTEAIADLNKAIEINPGNAEVYNVRGNIYYEQGDYEEAIADFSQAIELNPDHAESYFRRGNTYYRQEDYQQALKDYRQATSLKEDFLPGYVNIGLIHYETGDIEEAIALWQKAIELDSEVAEPQLALAVALYHQGNQEKGLEMASAALAKDDRLADLEFLQKNLWGDRLITSTQKLLEDSRLQANNR